MTQATKKRSNKADATVQKILSASLTRIITYGESGISMTEISREIGVSRPTLYRYFPTREILLENVFELILDDYMQKLDVKIAADPSPLRRIDIIVDFAATRLQDGGAQLFQLDPALVVKLMGRSQDRLIDHCEKIFSPLFDMHEALSGKKIARHTAATAYVLFNSALVFFGGQSTTIETKDLLKQMIRSLIQFEQR